MKWKLLTASFHILLLKCTASTSQYNITFAHFTLTHNKHLEFIVPVIIQSRVMPGHLDIGWESQLQRLHIPIWMGNQAFLSLFWKGIIFSAISNAGSLFVHVIRFTIKGSVHVLVFLPHKVALWALRATSMNANNEKKVVSISALDNEYKKYNFEVNQKTCIPFILVL